MITAHATPGRRTWPLGTLLVVTLTLLAPRLFAQAVELGPIPLVEVFDLNKQPSLGEDSSCIDLPLPGQEADFIFTPTDSGPHRIVVRSLGLTDIAIIASVGDPLQGGECLGSSDENGSGLPEVLELDLNVGTFYTLVVAEGPFESELPMGLVEIRIEPLKIDDNTEVARFDVGQEDEIAIIAQSMNEVYDSDLEGLWILGEITKDQRLNLTSSGFSADVFVPPYVPPAQDAPRNTLRFDRFLYPVATTSITINLRTPPEPASGSRDIVVASGSDVEQITLNGNVDRWTGTLTLQTGEDGGVQNDGVLSAAPGSFLMAIWQDPNAGGEPENSAFGLAMVEGRQPVGNVEIIIDPNVQPIVPEVPGPGPDAPPRPLGAAMDAAGNLVMLASNELVIDSDDGENAALENLTGGTVSQQGVISDNDPFRLLRFNPPPVDPQNAAVLMEFLGAEGELRVSDETTLALMVFSIQQRLRGVSASPNWIMTPHGQPTSDDPTEMFRSSDPGQDALQGIQKAWIYSAMYDAETPIPVAVIDSNFCREMATEATVLGGYDFFNDSSDPFGRAFTFGFGGPYHGTLMASVVASHFSNNQAAAGIAGSMAQLYLYNVGGVNFYKDAAAATRAAVDAGAQAINMSWGFPCGFAGLGWCVDSASDFFFVLALCPFLDANLSVIQAFLPFPVPVGPGACFAFVAHATESKNALKSAIDVALHEGIPVIASSGNAFGDLGAQDVERWQIVPATLPGVITVGATLPTRQNEHFFGSRVDVWLTDSSPAFGPPNSSSDCSGFRVRSAGGSSASAAMTTGVVAMMRNVNSSLSPSRIRSILRGASVAAPGPAGDPLVRRYLRAERALARAGSLAGHFDPRLFAPSWGFDEDDPTVTSFPPGWFSGPGAWLTAPLRPAADSSTAPIIVPRAEALAGTHLVDDAAIHSFVPAGRGLDEDWYQIETDEDACAAYTITIDLTYPTTGGHLTLDRVERPSLTVVGPLTQARWVYRSRALNEPFRFRVGGTDNFYNLRVGLTREPDVFRDRLEPNDAIFNARPVTFGPATPVPGEATVEYRAVETELSLNCGNDVDLFLVQLPDVSEICRDLAASCGVSYPGDELAFLQVSAGRYDVHFFDENFDPIEPDGTGRIACPREKTGGTGRLYIQIGPDTRLGAYELRLRYRTPESENDLLDWFAAAVTPYLCCERPAGVPCLPEPFPDEDRDGVIDGLVIHGIDLFRDFQGIFRIPECLFAECVDPELVIVFEAPAGVTINLLFEFQSPPPESFAGLFLNGLGDTIGMIEPISETQFVLSAPNVEGGFSFIRMLGLEGGTEFQVINQEPLSAPDTPRLAPRVLSGDDCPPTTIGIEVQAAELVAGMQLELGWDPDFATILDVRPGAAFGNFTLFETPLEPGRLGLGLADLQSATRVDATTPVVAIEVDLEVSPDISATQVCVRDVFGQAPEVFEPTVSVGAGGDARSVRALTGCAAVSAAIDTTPPTIVCPTEVSQEPTANGALVTWTVEASDNCGDVTVVCTPPSGSEFLLGTHTVVCEATDASGNITECEFEVVVEATPFRRGDANDDSLTDISDGIVLLEHLFLGALAPSCHAAGDANDDQKLDITDPIVILQFLFLGETPPPAPGPVDCGTDPTPDGESCVYTSC